MRWIIVVLAVASIACTSAQAPEPEPTPTPTATATPTPRATWVADPSVERNKALWAAMASATPRPIPTPQHVLVSGYDKYWPRWEYGPDRAWMVGHTTNRLVLDCATGEPELHIEITGAPLPGDGQDSIEIVWFVLGGPRDGTPDTWAKSADGRTLHPSGVFKLHVLADASWAAVDLPGADEVFWFVGPYRTIDTSRLSCVP